MSDIYPPTAQRPALLKLAEALVCRDAALRRDECGDWRINGDSGHIYATPEGFQIFVLDCETVRQWSAVKSAMKPFSRICNDGDMEGAFFLDRLPLSDEAEVIRRYVGIRKRREDSEATLAALRERTAKYGFQVKRAASDDGEAS